MIVDDESDMLLSFSKMLKESDFSAETFINSNEVLKKKVKNQLLQPFQRIYCPESMDCSLLPPAFPCWLTLFAPAFPCAF
jgi:hypothetical protein